MQLLNGTHHVSFTVADMDRSLRFYRDLLGLSVTADWKTSAAYLGRITAFPGAKLRIAFVTLPGDQIKLELIQYLEPAGLAVELRTNVPGAAHIGFLVADIWATYEALRARGVEFKSEPVDITSVANAGARGVYLTDPDGITLELMQPAPGK